MFKGKKVREDINIKCRLLKRLETQVSLLKLYILSALAKMEPDEIITEYRYTPAQTIIDREKMALYATKYNVVLPTKTKVEVDWKEAEVMMIETVTPEELGDMYKPKTAYISNPGGKKHEMV